MLDMAPYQMGIGSPFPARIQGSVPRQRLIRSDTLGWMDKRDSDWKKKKNRCCLLSDCILIRLKSVQGNVYKAWFKLMVASIAFLTVQSVWSFLQGAHLYNWHVSVKWSEYICMQSHLEFDMTNDFNSLLAQSVIIIPHLGI